MDPLKFIEKFRGEKVDADEILVSYNVTSLFTNVPVDETIKILVKKVKQKQMPPFYRRFVDDTITKQPSVKSANEFLSTLNNCHPSLQFTMEIEVDGKLPFLGAELIRKDDRLESKVYIKPTNTGLLLHFDSNVESRISVIIYLEVFHRGM